MPKDVKTPFIRECAMGYEIAGLSRRTRYPPIGP